MVRLLHLESSRLVSRAIVLAAFIFAIVATGLAVFHETFVPPGSIRIAKVRAAVVEMGELASYDFHDKVYGVRVRATVCFEPDARTVESYPIEFRITHFAFSESEPEFWGLPFRTVADNVQWLVPFGEAGFEDGCRDVVVEDVLPDSDYKGLESELGVLSAPPEDAKNHCYGVALRIKVLFLATRSVVRHTDGRALVQCGSFHPDVDIGR